MYDLKCEAEYETEDFVFPPWRNVCILLAGCGSETNVQELGAIKIEMQPTTEPTENLMEASTAVPSEVPAAEPTEVPVQEVTEAPDIETTTPEDFYKMATNKTARAAYQQVLTTILNDLKLPDGTELYFDGIGELSQNKFAIHDVDGDGREELILSYVTGPMAVQGKYVFGYNGEADEVYEQGRAFGMVFYDDGVIKAEASHNHGRGDKLWPYTVFYYSRITDDYRYGVHVDSWEKEYYGDTAQGAPFPAEVDADGDGIVYYLLPYDDYSYDSKDALDGKEYNEWYERQFDSKEIIKPAYYELTKENIEKVEEN